MLQRLSIRNIVLIEHCEITLADGLCVLSGETGAGKSILLDALGLVLGGRAETGLLRHGETQGSVSAEFDISGNERARAILSDLGIEPEESLIIRRTLGESGKSRCLVGDEPVTASALRRLSEALVEVHGQHDQRSLADNTLHRALLDDYGHLRTQRGKVAEAYRVWRREVEARETLAAEIERAAREQEYLRHMQGELEKLDPQMGEEEALSNSRISMMQGERMYGLLDEAISELSAGKGASPAIRAAQRVLVRSPLASQPIFAGIIEGLERAALETDEAHEALERAGREVTYDPKKLEEAEERLFALKAAGRKYNMPVDDLVKRREEIDRKLTLIDSQEHRFAELEKKAAEAKKAFVALADSLSAKRREAALTLQKAIEKELAPLRMDNTRFRVRVETVGESGWSEWGTDAVAFECATNVPKGAKDIPYAPLNKIASGGELSRFMLAMKVALSSVRQAPTLIFDEIDTGTGGAVADAIGRRLALLGQQAQVLVVTHLPQVAARGSQHLLIAKSEKAGKVRTSVSQLSDAEREEELARMLAGASVTAEARVAARKLLEDAA